jgi:transcriptional antiterminator RfaH
MIWVTEAMFPGYLFARFDLAEMHRQIRYAHGVSGIVRFADQYPTIDDEALAELRNYADDGEVKELNYELSQGDQVKVVEGVFGGLDAVVTQALPARERVKVLMDFLGTKVEAEVGRSNVLRQMAHPLAA